MKPCTTEFLAWCAGFFDGEGTINITKRDGVYDQKSKNGKKTYRQPCRTHVLDVKIGQNDRRPLDLLKNTFGGCVYFSDRKSSKYSEELKRFWLWDVASLKAEVFLRAIAPFSRVKKEQIKIALKFRDTFTGNPAGAGIDPAVFKKRSALREKLLQSRRAS